MRSLRTDLVALLGVILSGAVLGACIIGPKQDDPETSLVADTGTSTRGDDGIGTVTDAADLADTAGPPAVIDGGPSGDAANDGAGDACGDGCASDGGPLGDAADAGGEVAPDALGGD